MEDEEDLINTGCKLKAGCKELLCLGTCPYILISYGNFFNTA